MKDVTHLIKTLNVVLEIVDELTDSLDEAMTVMIMASSELLVHAEELGIPKPLDSFTNALMQTMQMRREGKCILDQCKDKVDQN